MPDLQFLNTHYIIRILLQDNIFTVSVMAEVEAAAPPDSNEPDYKRLHAYSLVRNTGNSH